MEGACLVRSPGEPGVTAEAGQARGDVGLGWARLCSNHGNSGRGALPTGHLHGRCGRGKEALAGLGGRGRPGRGPRGRGLGRSLLDT